MLYTCSTTRSQSDRQIRPQDFYVEPNEHIDEVASRELWIEARIAFPELMDGEASQVAPFFDNTRFDAHPPFVRAFLLAEWRRDSTVEGTIEEYPYWILSPDKEPDTVKEEDDELMRMKPHQRSLIRVEYIPARRDVVSQIRKRTGSVISELIRAVQWRDETETKVEEASTEMRKAVGEEPAVEAINEQLQSKWDSLHDGTYDQNPTLHIVEQDFEELVRNVNVSFEPTETGKPHTAETLSDGLRSLFYLSMRLSHHGLVMNLDESQGETPNTVEAEEAEEVETGGQENGGATDTANNGSEEGNEDGSDADIAFDTERLNIPQLVVFALEEPENHLAPYYLSRIIGQIHNIVESSQIQSVLTSHSASTLKRISPKSIRHFRIGDDQKRTTTIEEIPLPTADVSTLNETDAKYVRQAIQAYPELYFARFIVFAEGASEEFVLPRLAEAAGSQFDPSFVAVVPLGGRHVNHFWRLASDLDIPHATLLDLDMGRQNAGLVRIKNVYSQLRKVGALSEDESDVPDFPSEDETPLPKGTLQPILTKLEDDHGIFFSKPLDLDWSMMRAFPQSYKNSAGSPQSTTSDANENARRSVLGESSDARYQQAEEGGWYHDQAEEKRFSWYRYLFKTRSKPTTHLHALASLSNSEIRENMPDTLERLIRHVASELASQSN